ncbi:hypothetical protein DIPPA_20229 [Diplonema papillatum]|nr:hypothetical protein DIPPA_20229 [Diplonema papillatum]|eukprot:gene17374-26701_t
MKGHSACGDSDTAAWGQQVKGNPAATTAASGPAPGPHRGEMTPAAPPHPAEQPPPAAPLPIGCGSLAPATPVRPTRGEARQAGSPAAGCCWGDEEGDRGFYEVSPSTVQEVDRFELGVDRPADASPGGDATVLSMLSAAVLALASKCVPVVMSLFLANPAYPRLAESIPECVERPTKPPTARSIAHFFENVADDPPPRAVHLPDDEHNELASLCQGDKARLSAAVSSLLAVLRSATSAGRLAKCLTCLEALTDGSQEVAMLCVGDRRLLLSFASHPHPAVAGAAKALCASISVGPASDEQLPDIVVSALG